MKKGKKETAKTIKKKPLPTMLKETSEQLKKQADDITATIYLEEIKKNLPPLPKPLTEVELPLVKKTDYGVFWDCLSAVSFAGGFFLWGYAWAML